MNILLIKNVFVGFMVSDIPRVSVFGHCPYSVTFPCRLLSPIIITIHNVLMRIILLPPDIQILLYKMCSKLCTL